jgi:hypothetical protein
MYHDFENKVIIIDIKKRIIKIAEIEQRNNLWAHNKKQSINKS